MPATLGRLLGLPVSQQRDAAGNHDDHKKRRRGA